MKMQFILLISLMMTILAENGTQAIPVSQFFQTKNGEMIMDSETHPASIQDFLLEENSFVLSLVIQKYDYLLEAGCGTSQRALDIVRFGKQFYGIEINPNFVAKSLLLFQDKKIEDKATVDQFSVLDLNPSTYIIPKNKKTLVFFPFNLMGNLDDFHLVLGNLIDIQQDFCFSNYKLTQEIKETRHKYYSNCGCQKIRYSCTPIGNLFDSQDGLHSAAFKNSYIIELLDDLLLKKDKKAIIEISDLANVASMIYVHDIKDQ